MTKTIFFAGSSGNIAQSAIKSLEGGDIKIRAGIRDTDKGHQLFRGQQNVEVVELNIDKPDTLEAAFNEVDVVYFATLLAVPGDFEQAYVEAAIKSGTVKHIIHSTGSTADVPDVFPLCSEFIYKRENLVRDSGIGFTTLRPCMFMQNIASMHAEAIKTHRCWSEPVDAEAEIAYVDADDIGRCVAAIALNPHEHLSQTYTLTGPDVVTSSQMASILSNSLGEQINYKAISADDWSTANWGDVDVSSGQNWLFEVLKENYQGFSRGAEGRNLLNDNVAKITGEAAKSFDTFVANHIDAWRSA